MAKFLVTKFSRMTKLWHSWIYTLCVQATHFVVPKVQVDHPWDLTDDDISIVMSTVKKVALKLREF